MAELGAFWEVDKDGNKATCVALMLVGWWSGVEGLPLRSGPTRVTYAVSQLCRRGDVLMYDEAVVKT